VVKHNSLVELAFGSSALPRSRAFAAGATGRGSSGGPVAHERSAGQGLAFGESELADARALLGEAGEDVVFVVGRPNLAESAKVIETAIRTLAQGFPRRRSSPPFVART